MASRAAEEADSMWALLDVSPETIHSLKASVTAWSPEESTEDDELDEEFYSEVDEFIELIRIGESDRNSLTPEQRNRLDAFANAATLEERTRANAIIELENEEETGDERLALANQQILDQTFAGICFTAEKNKTKAYAS
ncbi:hypothetical protein D9757_010758 [Collybiopsis confluens]|uniref:Uncharacterized protein n=1 Tax=Collybiopsis confluens TaxID=2823264 RepID=A0A8H5M2Z7_9AGAR|nr:hypothetical protein D9757_010758 [Collybiopsis confluens]